MVREGEPATADRQAFVSGVFGDIFDVLVAAQQKRDAIRNYRAVVAGGQLEWNSVWATELDDYVRKGGILVLNAAQTKGLSSDFLGVKLLDATAEADSASCRSPGDEDQYLGGQVFRYLKTQLKGATVLMESPSGDPLITVNKLGQGAVVFCALPDLLGVDERITPFSAHLLSHVFTNAMPLRVTGDVEYLLNWKEDGWVVTLFNNNGVWKPQQGLAQVDRDASVTVKINVPGQLLSSAEEWLSGKKLNIEKNNGHEVTVIVAPGAVAIVELR